MTVPCALAVDRRPELLQPPGLFHGDAAGKVTARIPSPA
jgi:hypothetical protein